MEFELNQRVRLRAVARDTPTAWGVSKEVMPGDCGRIAALHSNGPSSDRSHFADVTFENGQRCLLNVLWLDPAFDALAYYEQLRAEDP